MPNIKVSLSSVVCQEIREYERASTVVMNAYLAGSVGKHFENVEAKLAKKGRKSQVSHIWLRMNFYAIQKDSCTERL